MQLYAYGVQGTDYTPAGNIDMNGFNITFTTGGIVDASFISVVQDGATGCALSVTRNLAAAATNSPIVCVEQLNATDDQVTLRVINASPTTTALIDQNNDGYGVEIQSAATTNTMYGLQVVTGSGATAANLQYDGSEFMRCVQTNQDMVWIYRNKAAAATGGVLLFVENDESTDDQIAVKIQQDAPAIAFDVQQLSVTTTALRVSRDGGAEYFQALQGQADANGTFYFYRNLAAANTAGAVVGINNANAGDDQYGLQITQTANAYAANFSSDGGNLRASFVGDNAQKYGIYIYRNLASAATGAPVAYFRQDNAGDDQPTVEIDQDCPAIGLFQDQNGAAQAISIDHDDTGATASIEIDRDGNNAADIWGIKIACDNAGAGGEGAIDMDSFTAGEPLFRVPADTTALGAYYGRIAVYVAGVGIRYISLYA